jgi:hypothetical protein
MLRTRADGTFSLCGELEEGLHTLDVQARGFVRRRELPLDRDRTLASGLELQLFLERAIEGRLVAPEGVSPSWFRVSASRPGLPGPAAHTRAFPDGTFRLDEVPPGPVDVVVSLYDSPAPVLARAGVELDAAPGSTTQLGDLDLTAVAHAVRVSVTGPSGEPIQRGLALWRPAWGDEPPLHGVVFEGGAAVLLASGEKTDLWVQADGHQHAFFEDVVDGARVRLQPGIAASLVFPEDLPLPDAPRALEVELVALDVLPPERSPVVLTQEGDEVNGWPVGRPSVSARLEGRELSLSLPFPGEYSVGWQLVDTSAVPPVRERLPSGVVRRVGVEGKRDGEPEVLSLAPDRDAYLRALALREGD